MRSRDQGASASPSGSRASHGAADASPPEASIPNAAISDSAIVLAFGWFSFGARALTTSHPPHANMTANRAALDELLAANLITHEHEYHKSFGIDRHHFKGTAGIHKLLQTDRAKAVLASALAEPGAPEQSA